MGLMMSILIFCVGVLEIFGVYADVRRRIEPARTGRNFTGILERCKRDLERERNRLVKEIEHSEAKVQQDLEEGDILEMETTTSTNESRGAIKKTTISHDGATPNTCLDALELSEKLLEYNAIYGNRSPSPYPELHVPRNSLCSDLSREASTILVEAEEQPVKHEYLTPKPSPAHVDLILESPTFNSTEFWGYKQSHQKKSKDKTHNKAVVSQKCNLKDADALANLVLNLEVPELDWRRRSSSPVIDPKAIDTDLVFTPTLRKSRAHLNLDRSDLYLENLTNGCSCPDLCNGECCRRSASNDKSVRFSNEPEVFYMELDSNDNKTAKKTIDGINDVGSIARELDTEADRTKNEQNNIEGNTNLNGESVLEFTKLVDALCAAMDNHNVNMENAIGLQETYPSIRNKLTNQSIQQQRSSIEDDYVCCTSNVDCIDSTNNLDTAVVTRESCVTIGEPTTSNSSTLGRNKTENANSEAFWLIFSGEYTKAMNKDWHGQHFCCWQCDESLTGQRYVLRDDHPYCVTCYESVFANSCEKCSKTIGIDSKDLSYKDKHWHEACFLCATCNDSLVDKQFGSKGERIYCGRCYDEQFASRCDGCGQIFRAGTKKMEYKTRQWHEKCFCCCVCKTPIGTQSFIPREQEIYCAKCYEEKYATRCIKCNKVITSGGVTYKNEPWHRECFTCTNCNTSLAGARFTSRDDKPYCAECFGELFAKRCTACNKPITGIGGTKFISFEDRHWHNDCFFCASCRTSLVGRGFITDGPDIICPECAKQRLM